MRLFADELLPGGSQNLLHATQHILAGVVVLVEHGDLRVGPRLQDVPGQDAPFVGVQGQPAHAPGELSRIIQPRGGAGRNEELRYFGVVEIAARRQPSGRAYLRREKSHLIALHQAARLLQGFRRAVAIVGQHQLELAPIHAALGVDQVKPCRHGLADDAIACGRAAERSGRADLDLAIRHARGARALRADQARNAGQHGAGKHGDELSFLHGVSCGGGEMNGWMGEPWPAASGRLPLQAQHGFADQRHAVVAEIHVRLVHEDGR